MNDEKYRDVAILEDGDLKQFSIQSPNPWNNDKMNNPFKRINAGNNFEDLGISFKH